MAQNHEYLTFVDVETTGLDAFDIHQQIIELSTLQVLRATIETGFTYSIVGEFTAKIKLLPGNVVDPRAAEVNGYNPELWKNAIPFEHAWLQAMDLMEYSTLVAQNALFDLTFLKVAVLREGLSWPRGSYRVLDLHSLAHKYRAIDPQRFPTMSLDAMGKYFVGTPQPKPHTAKQDVELAFSIYKELMAEEWRLCTTGHGNHFAGSLGVKPVLRDRENTNHDYR